MCFKVLIPIYRCLNFSVKLHVHKDAWYLMFLHVKNADDVGEESDEIDDTSKLGTRIFSSFH